MKLFKIYAESENDTKVQGELIPKQLASSSHLAREKSQSHKAVYCL